MLRNSARRVSKRRAAFALSASVLAINTGMVGASNGSGAVTRIDLHQPIDATQHRVHAGRISVSDDFKRALIEEEGVHTRVYRDVAGYATVGVGHLVTAADGLNVGDTIDATHIARLLEQDIAIAEDAARRLVGGLRLYQHEFDALVDLIFNVGEGNVDPSASPRLNRAIMTGDYGGIARELDYRHAGGSVARGLIFRSERREAIFTQAAYDNPRIQT